MMLIARPTRSTPDAIRLLDKRSTKRNSASGRRLDDDVHVLLWMTNGFGNSLGQSPHLIAQVPAIGDVRLKQ